MACSIADAVGVDGYLNVQTQLAELIQGVETIRALARIAEYEYTMTDQGEALPNLVPLETIRGLLPKMYPRAIEILQTIGAGGLMMSPTGADFVNPETEADMHKYYVGSGISSEKRVRLFKLAWDLCGEAFGQRLLQYERYYSGDPAANWERSITSISETILLIRLWSGHWMSPYLCRKSIKRTLYSRLTNTLY